MRSSATPAEFEPGRFFGSFFNVARAVLLTPKTFFEKMTRQGPFANPFIFLAGCVGTHTFFAALLHRMPQPSLIIQNLIMGLTLPFLTAGILFLILTRLFNSPGTYAATFRLSAYASAVGLVTWIPVIGVFFELYRLYVLTIALRCVYIIKTSRAVITIFLTLVVYTLLFKLLYHLAGGRLID